MDPEQDEIRNKDEQTVPEDNAAVTEDEKLAKFKEIGTRRVSNACKAIQLIGNLSNRGAYHYDNTLVEKMFAVLEEELAATKAKFQPAKEEKRPFSFD